MSGPDDTPAVLRFSVFEVDLHSQELRKHGVRLRLPGQSFQILRVLLENSGRVVSREDLRDKLWSTDTFVDFDHGLNAAVNRLREALGDSADHPKFIETLPRRGYRFIGSLDGGKTNAASAITPAAAVAALGPSTSAIATNSAKAADGHPNLRVRSALLLVTAGTAAVVLAFWAPKPNRSNWQIESVSALAGFQGEASFSPDGNSIAFSYKDEQAEDSHPDIYVKVIGDERMLRLTNPPGTSFAPAWSPDGKAIAYVHRIEESPGKFAREIMVMTPLGGSKRLLRRPSSDFGSKISWSPDGKLLAYEDDKLNEPSGIFLMSASGADVRRLTTAPPNTLDRDASFSPDGRQIAFIRIRTIYKTDIYIVPVAGGEPKRLTFLNTGVFSPVWTPDGRRIIFSLGGWIAGLYDVSASDGKRWLTGLYAVPVSGGLPERLSIPQMGVSNPAISRDGDKIAFQRQLTRMSIWKLPIDDTGGSPTKFIASTSMDNAPEFSPDGSRVAFSSLRDGTESLWSCDADGGDAIRVVSLQLGGSAAWSPDSTHIAFDDRATGRSQIYLIGLRDHDTQRITDGDFDNVEPAWSADGRSVYFASGRTGRPEIWKLLLSTKELVQITRNAGSHPQESPDGKFVYYNKTGIDDRLKGVWRIPTSGGVEEQILTDSNHNFRVRSQGIYYTGFDSTGSKRQPVLKMYSFATGDTRVLGRLAKPASLVGRNLTIAPDGRHALYAQFDVDTSEIMLAKGGGW